MELKNLFQNMWKKRLKEKLINKQNKIGKKQKKVSLSLRIEVLKNLKKTTVTLLIK